MSILRVRYTGLSTIGYARLSYIQTNDARLSYIQTNDAFAYVGIFFFFHSFKGRISVF